MSTTASTLVPRPPLGGRGDDLAQATAAALEPLQVELLRRAHAEAAERIQRAAADDAATIGQAEGEAAAILEMARQEGISEAAVLIAAQRARSRRQARAVILRARAEVVAELRRRSIAAIAQFSREPSYPELRNRLVDYVRANLGEAVMISDSETGGVIGTVPGRRLDCSFATLIEQALAERAPQPGMHE